MTDYERKDRWMGVFVFLSMMLFVGLLVLLRSLV